MSILYIAMIKRVCMVYVSETTRDCRGVGGRMYDVAVERSDWVRWGPMWFDWVRLGPVG